MENHIFNRKDFEDLSKEDLIGNLKSAIENIARLEKGLDIEKVEKERLRLHKENQELRKEIGMLLFVKEILETAKIYAYNDLSKVQQVMKHQEELRKMKEDEIKHQEKLRKMRGQKVTTKPSQ